MAWKLSPESALNIVGCADVLNFREVADACPIANHAVLAQLNQATCKGAANFRVKKHNQERDGHSAWQNLNLWCESDANAESRVTRLRLALSDAKLAQGGDTQGCINEFIKALHDINKVEGEEWSDTQAKQTFLDDVLDQACDPTIEVIKRNKHSMILQEVANSIHGKSLELT